MRNKLAQKIKLGAALLLMAGTSAFAQTSNQIYTPTPENIKARQEFQDNKFGIFLHWCIFFKLQYFDMCSQHLNIATVSS
jgi:alpha-L-fucosidase